MNQKSEPQPESPKPDALWWNSQESPTLDARLGELRGNTVLLCFLRLTDVNCERVLPLLHRLALELADRAFQVLAVYSAKFTGEDNPLAFRLAMRRHRIGFPVLFDAGRRLWQKWDCFAWPSFWLFDAEGVGRWHGHGVPDLDRLRSAVRHLLDEEDARNGFATAPPLHEPDLADLSLDGLRRPDGLAVDAWRSLLWVSDSGNHRVLGVDLQSGCVRHVVGCGLAGAADGVAVAASFDTPRGLCVDESTLFIVDTGNHLLRRVDLDNADGWTVTTCLGIGVASGDRQGGLAGIDQGLCAPADLCALQDELLLTMQGGHQIWRIDRNTMVAMPIAGAVRSGFVDAPGHRSELAQPVGIDVDPDRRVVAFVDADNCAVRLLDLDEGDVVTLVGAGPFDSGDRDGELDAARLQWPGGVALLGADRSQLLLTDTLNHKVKLLDPVAGEIKTLFGSADGLCYPTAITVQDQRVFVGNSGDGQILTADLAAAHSRLRPLELSGLPRAATGPCSAYVEAAPIELVRYAASSLRVALPLPPGEGLHPEVPVRAFLRNVTGRPVAVDFATDARVDGGVAEIGGVPAGDEDGELRLRIAYASCLQPSQGCHLHELRLSLPVRLMTEGATTVTIQMDQTLNTER